MIKAVIFDMDGIMFDTEHLAIPAWCEAGRKMGYPITEKIVYETFGMNRETTKKVLQGYFGENFNFDETARLRTEYEIEYIEKNGVPIKKGLIELLHYLKENGYLFTVATSSGQIRTRHLFELAGITHFFGKFVCGDMIQKGKPEPEIYCKACELLKVTPENSIVLEDSYTGIIAAFRAGIKTVMIPDMMQCNESIEKMLYAKLNSLLEVIPLLEKEKSL